MYRLFASWLQSMQLFRLNELKRFFFLFMKTVARLMRWLPLYWILALLSSFFLFTSYQGYSLHSLYIVRSVNYWRIGWFIQALLMYLLLITIRASTGLKDVFYIMYDRRKWFVYFLLFYWFSPTFIMPAVFLLFFFFLDTYGTFADLTRSFYNTGAMLLFNIPLFLMYWAVFLILNLLNRNVFLVIFLPVLLCVLWILYTKRRFDDFTLYLIE